MHFVVGWDGGSGIDSHLPSIRLPRPSVGNMDMFTWFTWFCHAWLQKYEWRLHLWDLTRRMGPEEIQPLFLGRCLKMSCKSIKHNGHNKISEPTSDAILNPCSSKQTKLTTNCKTYPTWTRLIGQGSVGSGCWCMQVAFFEGCASRWWTLWLRCRRESQHVGCVILQASAGLGRWSTLSHYILLVNGVEHLDSTLSHFCTILIHKHISKSKQEKHTTLLSGSETSAGVHAWSPALQIQSQKKHYQLRTPRQKTRRDLIYGRHFFSPHFFVETFKQSVNGRLWILSGSHSLS